MMDCLNNDGLIVLALQQCCSIIFSSSSDESEDDSNDYKCATQFINSNHSILWLHNYVETIVPQFNNQQFKAHFRILPTTFEFVLTLIDLKLKRTKPGLQSVPPNKQFLIAIWKITTPDSYRSICKKFDVA